MAQPTTREEFKEWCLRKLGKPIIEINLDDDQIEDRIDEALSYYQDFHFDGTEKTFLKHPVTANNKADGYITISEDIIGIVNLFDIGYSSSTNNMFNMKYQMMLNDVWDMSQFPVSSYWMSMQNLALLEEILVGKQPLRYNRHTNKLYIDMDWDRVAVGSYIIIECYTVTDPDTYSDVWKDRWLQNYATALIKENWCEGLTKFSQLQLPGGVTFNAEQKLNEARDEKNRLEEQMISSYSLPVADMMG